MIYSTVIHMTLYTQLNDISCINTCRYEYIDNLRVNFSSRMKIKIYFWLIAPPICYFQENVFKSRFDMNRTKRPRLNNSFSITIQLSFVCKFYHVQTDKIMSAQNSWIYVSFVYSVKNINWNKKWIHGFICLVIGRRRVIIFDSLLEERKSKQFSEIIWLK